MHDVICVIDSRFSGGTTAALAEDVHAFLAAGLRVGVVEVRSPYLDGDTHGRNRLMQTLLDDPRIDTLDPAAGDEVAARAVFLHHPMTFFRGVETPFAIRATRCFLVAHHLPFRGDGSLQYDPVSTSLRIRRTFGVWPQWLPVSGLCRQQLNSFKPMIKLAPLDWPNVFDLQVWTPQREIFSGPLTVIGRHGRADILKWPDTLGAISASLPRLPSSRIHVMGCPRDDFAKMGVDVSDWTLLDFDARPVPAFLGDLDIFVYHFHSTLSESFGRTVAEAMLTGTVCVLDPRLAATFGDDVAIYCPPEHTAAAIEELRADPARARALAERARGVIATRHAPASVPLRLEKLLASEPARDVTNARYAPPLTVLRKTIGMMRRGELSGGPPKDTAGIRQRMWQGAEQRACRALRGALQVRARDMTASAMHRPTVILAPHADDETLGCGGLIALKRRHDTSVTVFMATDGSASHRYERTLVTTREELVDLRRQETLAACQTLGIPPEALHFANLPDGELGAHLDALTQAIADVLRNVAPAEVYVCAHSDGHPDHRALAQAARRAVHGLSDPGLTLFEYPIWSFDFRSWRPEDGTNTTGFLRGTAAMARSAATWRMHSVRIDSVREQKACALAAHRSQLGHYPPEPHWSGLPPSFLGHFLGATEIFREVGTAEIAR